jgi:hypothetical protein
VFLILKNTMIFPSSHKSMIREAYMKEIQEVFKLTLLDTFIIYFGTPLSGSTLDCTCIQTDLCILKPTMYQSTIFLTAIVPLRTILENILFSTWVIE